VLKHVVNIVTNVLPVCLKRFK